MTGESRIGGKVLSKSTSQETCRYRYVWNFPDKVQANDISFSYHKLSYWGPGECRDRWGCYLLSCRII